MTNRVGNALKSGCMYFFASLPGKLIRTLVLIMGSHKHLDDERMEPVMVTVIRDGIYDGFHIRLDKYPLLKSSPFHAGDHIP